MENQASAFVNFQEPIFDIVKSVRPFNLAIREYANRMLWTLGEISLRADL
jgi:hypothetical protein